METTQNFNVCFLARQSKQLNTKARIYARLTVNGLRKEFSLQTTIDASAWNQKREKLIASHADSHEINHFIENVRSQLYSIHRELTLKKETISPDVITNHFMGIKEDGFTLKNLVDFHDVSQKDVLAWGTLKNYQTTVKYLSKFLMDTKNASDILLNRLNYRFIAEFESYLRAYEPRDHHKSLSNNGVMKHLERLRKMANLAVKLEWIEKNPFVSYRLSFKRVERPYLTSDELEAIEAHHFTIERLEYVKDLFVFSCYTGFAYIDVCQLSPKNLVKGIDGTDWIHTEREKTETPVHVPLLPQALSIIERYKNHPRSIHTGTLFPIISNQKLNSYLKEVADICGITKNLTFHIARHTFATTVTLSNGMPIETVSKLLGHTTIKTTQIYAKVIEQKVSDDMMQLKNRLSMI